MFWFERRHLTYVDWLTPVLILCISFIGLLFVCSATYQVTSPLSLYFKKQLCGVLSGVGLFILFASLDYRITCRWGYLLYFAIIGLLAFTLLKGSMGMGAKRWIDLHVLKFQPSELTKMLFPPWATYYIYTHHTDEYTIREWALLLFFLCVSACLIMRQPDLGTAIIILLAGLLLLWFAGLNGWFFAWLIAIGLITAPITYRCLKEYQKKRIAVFLGYGDVTKERYHLEQSKIAIGSGGWRGKGYLKGTQNKLLFLPESRTDFIFSVVCEEWGFCGALLVLMLYAMLFLRLILAISTIRDLYSQLLAIGLLVPTIVAMIINLGMVVGLLPIVGIPLPLMSYGVANLWVTYASLGWLFGIIIRKKMHP